MRKNKPSGKRKGSMLYDALFYDTRLDNLPFSAFRLLIELNQMYHGFNNGNLAITPKTLRFDWNDKTLKNAKNALLKADLIEITRFGVKRRPTLYALCHQPVDECEKNSIRERMRCTTRAMGKRENFFPVRRDRTKELREELAKSNIK